MALDSYTSAVISMVGMTFDSIGGLYLAYDLLGGERGPLSKVTRIVTYSLISIICYSSALNLKFALIAGIGLGSLFGLQLDWLGAGKKADMRMTLIIAISRFFVLGFALSSILPLGAAWIVGAGGLFGSLIAQRCKVSPEFWYEASIKPTFNIRRLGIGVILGCLMATLVYIGETVCGAPDRLGTALHLGMAAGLGTSMVATVSPFIEYYADHVQPRSLGYMGAILFMIGFLIQSIPSLIVLLST